MKMLPCGGWKIHILPHMKLNRSEYYRHETWATDKESRKKVQKSWKSSNSSYRGNWQRESSVNVKSDNENPPGKSHSDEEGILQIE